MADEVDLAQELGDLLLGVALQNVGRLPESSCEECEECGVAIPIERRLAVNARLCVGCQEYAEAVRRRNG